MTDPSNTLEAAGIPAGATPIGTLTSTEDGPMFCWFGRNPDVNDWDETLTAMDCSDYSEVRFQQ